MEGRFLHHPFTISITGSPPVRRLESQAVELPAHMRKPVILVGNFEFNLQRTWTQKGWPYGWGKLSITTITNQGFWCGRCAANNGWRFIINTLSETRIPWFVPETTSIPDRFINESLSPPAPPPPVSNIPLSKAVSQSIAPRQVSCSLNLWRK